MNHLTRFLTELISDGFEVSFRFDPARECAAVLLRLEGNVSDTFIDFREFVAADEEAVSIIRAVDMAAQALKRSAAQNK